MDITRQIVRGLELKETEVAQLEGKYDGGKVTIRKYGYWELKQSLRKRFSPWWSENSYEILPDVQCSNCDRKGNLRDVLLILAERRDDFTSFVIWSSQRRQYSCPMCGHGGWLVESPKPKQKEEGETCA